MEYKYGEEISYDYSLIEPNDYEALRTFDCGNKKLNDFIHNEVIKNGVVNNEDGLLYKVVDSKLNRIIGVVSLAASGILVTMTGFTKILPGVKIDVFAIDKMYQKLHYDKNSADSKKSSAHYYFSDEIMGIFIKRCNTISEQYAHARYITLYADKKAYRFYKRNFFKDFTEFMEKENNMEIRENIPMYMSLK